jgi:RHS repeat-associated protein
MGNLTSRSLGTSPPPDPGGLSIPGRHVRSTTTVTGQVDRLSFTFVGTTPKISVVTANSLDHTVSYDDVGNETGYYVARTYSPRNLMNAVTDTSGEGPAHSISYGYDYRGVRVSRTESPTDAGSASRYYFYTPELQLLSSTVDDSYNVWGQSAHIMSAPLVMNREVIWFNGAPVGEFGPPRTPDTTTELSRHRTFDTNTPANNVFYTFTDHLGTPLIQTDPTTAIVWRAEHEPYGNVYLMRKGARTDQPLRFPGQEAAMTWEGTEENYNVFRWYRGGWGRYTQADRWYLQQPVYAYAWNNPIDGFDKTGQVTIKTGPTVVHKADISTVYHECKVSMGGGLKGCMDDHLKFSCDCHCTSLGLFLKDITLVSPSFDIWAATNATADNGPYIVPVDLIVNEEMKHVTKVKDWLNSVRDSLELLESTPYGSYKDCVKGCPAIYDWLRSQYKTNTLQVDATHPSY